MSTNSRLLTGLCTVVAIERHSPGEKAAASRRAARKIAAAALIGALGFVVSACGGGGGGSRNAAPPAPNSAPTASFTATPTSGTAPLAVQFDASASTDSDGTISAYSWSFGDSSATGSGATTTHTFQANGSYTVTLTVTDNGGATNSTTHSVSVSAPPAATLPKIASIDNGDMTVCAVGVDGTAWCWGPNNYGQLGTGDTVKAFVPRAAAAGYEFRKVMVSNGGAFTCGITTGDLAYCWGNQNGGRLGDGVVPPSGQFVTAPVAVVGGHTFTDIAVGGDHACAVATDGTVYCWGYNTYGQLGTGNNSNSSVPVPVAGGLKFTSITAHQMVTCGITTDGDGYCWGNGYAGNLGSGSTSSTNVPVRITGGLKFSSLSLGVWTACGVTIAADGYCWGFNGSGELGIGSKNPSEALEPMLVADGHKWKSISAGVAVTCGVATDGRGFCWGGNTFGERGDGPFPAADVTSPVPVVGALVFDSIDADWVSCGVASNAAYCWGPGSEGGVGDGTGADRGVPTKVAGQ